MPGMKTGLWFGNFPNILTEIFVLNSTITACPPLLYHTCCINGQEQDGVIVRVKMRFTAYNVPPNFHFVYIVFIIYQLSFSSPHILHPWLAVCDCKWDQKFKAKIHRARARTHTHTLACIHFIFSPKMAFKSQNMWL